VQYSANMAQDELLTRTQLSKKLQVNLATIWRWEKKGMPRIPLGPRLIRYRLPDVLDWLKGSALTPCGPLPTASETTESAG
jgi:predicted DNA-binding transcriptional regulator AlpA